MVTANGDGQGTRRQYSAHAYLDIGMAACGVGVDDVGVANIDNAHVRAQIGGVILVIIGARMAKGEQGRSLAHRPWPEPRAGSPLGAEIIRCAKDGDIGVDRAPILDIGFLGKGRDADEGQVQASAFISVCAHKCPLRVGEKSGAEGRDLQG